VTSLLEEVYSRRVVSQQKVAPCQSVCALCLGIGWLQSERDENVVHARRSTHS
jgi:hypothetical protein